ncbi:MAG: GTP 3',8-cyclase MoaA [Ignavibacteriae bacterium]|nr:GTP 3',8-cyclase MoaA [Ignavibacteriota bacterium]
MKNLPLVDNYKRVHTYLRISVTERCNLRCRYCMPPDGIELMPRAEILTFDEIETLAKQFVELGIRKIRVTGGEPLVRKNVDELCARLAAIEKLETLALTTNGIKLGEKAQALRDAGVSHLNISLDTLKPEKFHHITFRDNFQQTIHGIEKALQVGFPSVKINTVVMKEFNDDELLDFVDFAKALSLNIRFIEYMPFLENGWNEVKFMSYREMKDIIESKHTLVPFSTNETVPGPAKDFLVEGSEATIGFITTMSEHFCGDCNRLRLTADGKLRNCLFGRDDFDLKRLLRSGASPDIIEDTIRSAVILKWEKHPDTEELVEMQSNAMVAIGG